MHKNGFCCTDVENLSVSIGRRALLRGVSFSLHCGEMTVIIGRNGAGKTTLLRALLGELSYSGHVGFQRHDGIRRRLNIGYVPQRLPVDPNAPTSVYDLCAAFLSRQPVFLFRDAELERRIAAHLEAFGAGQLIHQRLASLSGGEWQRVMLAIATDPVPELLILDEPASGVDKNGLTLFYEKLNALKCEQDMSILMVSHDLQFLSQYADRVVLLDEGQVLTRGAPEEVFASQAFRDVFGPAGGGPDDV